MEINTIGVLGAGAVGASIASMILRGRKDTSTEQFAIIADGERSKRLASNGLIVNGEEFRPIVTDDGEFDLIIVATKSFDLKDACPLLHRVVSGETLVMSLLNGISSERVLQDSLPEGRRRVIPAMIVGIDALRDAAGVQYLNRGTIHYGADPIHYPVPDDAIGAVESFFTRVGIPYQVSPDIVRTLWWKFMVNVGINQVSAVISGDYGTFQKSPDAMVLMRSAMEEVVSLSQNEGTGLKDQDIESWIETLKGLDPQGKTSMLQDVQAGRKTEVDIFAGTVLEHARIAGIPAPVNRFLYHMIKLIESRGISRDALA